VRKVLQDSRFSQVPATPGYPFVSEPRAALLLKEKPSFNSMDPPEQTKYRRMMAPMFTAGSMEKLRPRIQEIVDDLLDKMIEKGPPADFVESFALPLPSLVISELLGVPFEDRELFTRCAKDRFDTSAPPEVPLAAGELMGDYLTKLIDRRDRENSVGSDVISRLIREQIRPGHLARDEAMRMVRLVLLAGFDTTASMIELGTLLLLQSSDQLERLKNDPSLVKNAVEEMLRHGSISQFNASRAAIADVDIGGQTIKCGEGIIASLAGANRDPAFFKEPDKFDIHRNAKGHLAFGFGIHQCLGQNLARLELHIVFESLFQRLPNLQLAVPIEQIRFTHSSLSYGVYEMPVKW
jgi:cytochrome P450